MAERPVPQFDPTGPAQDVSIRWAKWKRSFQYYLAAEDITDSTRSKAKLLHLVGPAVQDVFDTLPEPPAPTDGSVQNSYDKVVTMLDSYFQYTPNVMFERHTFRRLAQMETETVAQFGNRLVQQAKLCLFADQDEQVCDQLVEKCIDDRLRRKFLEKQGTLKLKDALELSRQFEATELSARGMSQSRSAPAPVRLVSSTTGTRTPTYSSGPPGAECSNCGLSDHTAESANCPARGKECLNCHKKGHYKRKCRKPVTSRSSKTGRRGRGGGTHQVVSAPSAHSAPASQQKPVQHESYAIGKVTSPLNESDSLFVSVFVNERPLRMEVDTGAKVTLVPEHVWEQSWSDVPLAASQLQLTTYDGSSLPVVGETVVEVAYGEQSITDTIVVVKGGSHPLLGRNWLHRLRLDWPSLFRINSVSSTEADFKNEFPVVFGTGLGTVKDHQAEIHLKEGATPRCCSARPVPYALRPAVERELDRLEGEGIIRPVKSAEWASPLVIVSKKNGDIRLCADFKVTINRHIDPPIHAYAQLPLSEASQKYCVIATHRGLYAFNRLPFGVASAPAIWQQTMDQILQGIPGVVCFYDDILITGATPAEHDERLRQVLERLAEFGVRLRLEKCVLSVDQVRYLGFTVSGEGIQTNGDKVAAIVDAPPPKDQTALQSFIGLVMFYSRFVPSISDVLQPLRQLLVKDAPWDWSSECQESFEKVKSLMADAPILAHFDINRKVIVECDASPYGLGACLLQEDDTGSRRPVCFVSRALSSAESHYSQIEREALAIVFAVKRLHMYLYGRPFVLRTDHKPLLRIFGPHSDMPATAVSRLQRWAVILSEYEYQIEHISGTANVIADCLSRLPLKLSEQQEATVVNAVLQHARDPCESLPVSAADVAAASKDDAVISRIMQYLQFGWPADTPDDLQAYRRCRNELTIESGCLVRGHRTVIPVQLRRALLQELHSVHLGIVRMKSVARSFFWWPGIDDDIKHLATSCRQCQDTANAPPKEAPHPWIYPSEPFERVHVDFAEHDGQHYFLLVDAYSKWLSVYKMSSTTTHQTLECLLSFLSTYGIPKTLVSDNGPQFTSHLFRQFCLENGISHKCTPPYHPASNGQVERCVQELKKALRTRPDNVSAGTQLHRFVFAYRNTPHSTTQVTPASLVFKKSPNVKFSLLKPNFSSSQRQRQTTASSTKRDYTPGDAVAVLNTRNGNGPKWIHGTIAERLGPLSYIVRTGEQTRHVHSDHLRMAESEREEETEQIELQPQPAVEFRQPSTVPAPVSAPAEHAPAVPAVEPAFEPDADIEVAQPLSTSSEAKPAQSPRRSSRQHRPRQRLIEEL
ncbi:uncharacterized protein K02A2.6-like [Sycon ciliatum]|uniref:uncharacterized protein K02A2.6-like n=1 Tax=Sycon ciliatum TaxID=27933 RepID=UPI0031F6F49A